MKMAQSEYPMSKVISSSEAARLINDGDTVSPGGFGCCGHPEAITRAIEDRFNSTGRPRNLTLFFAAGSGDTQLGGLNRLRHTGLVSTIYGGFWGFVPELVKAAKRGEIKAHNWPQGVVSKLYRSIASQDPGLITDVGIGTFVDPRNSGGCLNDETHPEVEHVEINGRESLLYPSKKIDVAYIRATSADQYGNLSMEEEVCLQDSLVQAQAAHNSGGIVIAQVKNYLPDKKLPLAKVKVPGCFVDYLVIAEDERDHPQTYEQHFNLSLIGQDSPEVPLSSPPREILDARSIIANRAAQEINRYRGKRSPVINLGIGIPAEIGQFVDIDDTRPPILSIEGGTFGGRPTYGLSFGASEMPDAIIDQNSLFDFYDGGGLDMAFLGFAQIDKTGCVNVSSYGDTFKGAGGFINITRAAKKLYFCGTLTSGGLRVSLDNGQVCIHQEGRHRKFIQAVEQICFNPSASQRFQQEIKVITERCVMAIRDGSVFIEELYEGVDFDTHIKPFIDFEIANHDQPLRSIASM